MIDTVTLVVPMREIASGGFESHEEAERNEWNLVANKRGFRMYARNAPVHEAEEGMYFPRLTGYATWNNDAGEHDWKISIEFSAPKILYGQNLDELAEEQFGDVVRTLRNRLLLMDVDVPERAIRNAGVRKVHYSKNILLRPNEARYAIAQIRKVNSSKRVSQQNMEYSNDGEGVNFRTQSYAVSVYDKLCEMRHEIGRGSADAIATEHSVLRIEVRLQKKQKLNNVLEKLGFERNPTFREAFSGQVSKTVLNYYWESMLARDSALLFSRQAGVKDVLRDVLLAYPGITARKAIFLAGLVFLARDGDGIRELRGMLHGRVTQRTWYHIARELRGLGARVGGVQPDQWHEDTVHQLHEFRPLRLLSQSPSVEKQ